MQFLALHVQQGENNPHLMRQLLASKENNYARFKRTLAQGNELRGSLCLFV
jgi:uncharacterized protein YqiB (DUF1249 family)